MSISVCYPDKYAVEETFQLLKVPWEWYEPGHLYEVVIARKADVEGYAGNLIDLTKNDIFCTISDLLNTGRQHLHEPACDILLDQLRQELKKYTLLVEIPPVPWGHSYLVALTHDVDVTSVRECRYGTVGNAAFQCFRNGFFQAGFRFCLARFGIGNDPWALFESWKTLENQLGIRSTFFFVPKKDDFGVRAHHYRAVGYSPRKEILDDLAALGWEVGVHGIDNWADPEEGKKEMAIIGKNTAGNRTHWLLFDRNSWTVLDDAGYSYDSTFGYNDDAGFRAGTTQVYRPRDTKNLLELPLHIQDLGLFGKFCWAPSDKGWEKTPCLHLTESSALDYCNRILDFAKKYGGAVTLLWHYENITPPRDWSGLYHALVKRAKKDGAYVSTAGNVVQWFRMRRSIRVTLTHDGNCLYVTLSGNLSPEGLPAFRLRVYIPPERIHSADAEFTAGTDYIDIIITRRRVKVQLHGSTEIVSDH